MTRTLAVILLAGAACVFYAGGIVPAQGEVCRPCVQQCVESIGAGSVSPAASSSWLESAEWTKFDGQHSLLTAKIGQTHKSIPGPEASSSAFAPAAPGPEGPGPQEKIEAPLPEEKAPPEEKIEPPSQEMADNGVLGTVYGAPDAVIVTEKELKPDEECLKQRGITVSPPVSGGGRRPSRAPQRGGRGGFGGGSRPMVWQGGSSAGPCYRAVPAQDVQTFSVEAGSIIGQDMTLATDKGGAGIKLWSGADAKVTPNSELLMRGCKPGDVCRSELKKGSAHFKTPPAPKAGAEGKAGEAAGPSAGSEGAKEKKKGKPVNKMAVTVGPMALSFVAAEVVTNISKKGEASAIVLGGKAEAACSGATEKILLNPGMMIKSDPDGFCGEPKKIDTKKLNPFWKKIK